MKIQESLLALKNGQTRSFALVGPESYLKWRFINATCALYPESIFSVFYPEDEEDALSALFSASLYGSRIIILKRFEKFNVKRFGVLKGSADIVICEFSEEIDRNRDVTTFLSNISMVECTGLKPYVDEYVPWISSRFNDAGYSFSEGVCEEIYDLIGPNMFRIHNELKKLFLYKLDNKSVLKEDVSKVIYRGRISAPYELLEAILGKNPKKIFAYLERYLKSNEDYVSIVNFLGTYFEKMLKIILMKEQGKDSDVISDILGIPRFIIKNRYMPKALALGKSFFSSAMDRLCALDLGLRTFRGDKKILVEKYFQGFNF